MEDRGVILNFIQTVRLLSLLEKKLNTFYLREERPFPLLQVMELLVHINKRIKNNNNIQLPMEALLLQYQVVEQRVKNVK